jgi:hypothetical protein
VTRVTLIVCALLPLTAVLLFGTIARALSPQRSTDLVGPIYGDHRVTQTINPENRVLSAIDVRIATYARRNNGHVTLRVYRGDSPNPLRTVSVPARELHDNGLQRFPFEPMLTSYGVGTSMMPPLWFSLENSAGDMDNAIAVAAYADEDVGRWPQSTDGSPVPWMSFDETPLQLRLAYSSVYSERASDALAATLGQSAGSAPALMLALLAIFLPGALLARLCLGSSASGVAVTALAPAFGVALIAVITLWAGILGVRAGPVLPVIVLVAATIGYVAVEVARHRDSRRVVLSSPGAVRWAGIAALGAVALGLGFRAVALDGVATPPGADSYHHTLITQLIMDHGGVPADYSPFAPISSFAYHFGFHATAAWIGGMLGWDALRAVATVGLLLNGLAALSVYGLATLAGLGPVTAAVAALVTAVASPFPMWFLDVGRYPQEAALVVFPVAAAVALGYTERRVFKVVDPSLRPPGVMGSLVGTPHEERRPLRRPEGAVWNDDSPQNARRGPTSNARQFPAGREDDPPKLELGLLVGGAVLAAGLFLAHYRIALMLLLLIALHLIWMAIQGRRDGFLQLRRDAARCGVILLGAGLLVAPWIVRLMEGFTLGIRGSDGRYAADYYNLERLGTALSHPALGPLAITAAVGVVLAIAMRAPLLGLLAAWGALLFAGSNPHWLRLPGAGALDSVTVVSSLYVGAALAVGYLAQRTWEATPTPFRGRTWVDGGAHRLARAPVRPVLMIVLGLLAGWGALQLPGLVRAEQALADTGDLKAAEWIARQLPAHARVLVNASIVGWEPDFVAPTDGGAWLPLLAGRATTLLPLVYAGERGAAPEEVDRMEEIARLVRVDPAAPVTLQRLQGSGVTHVYLGVRGGPIEERKLLESPAYRRVYASEGVSIYELVESR